MVEILESSYEEGARGFHIFSYGKMCDAAKIMLETHSDYVITGSTLPSFAGPDPLIEDLVDVGAKIIFIHASLSDKKETELFKLIDKVSSRGVIPGIAVHTPIPTLEFNLENAKHVKCYLVPFAVNGYMMENQKKLEEMVDINKDKSFFGMKTLAAGSVDAEKAYNYISEHNICSVIIGQVDIQESKLSTKTALEALSKKNCQLNS
jgi:pentose-5-phosphate-3-epimerase